MGVAKPRLGVVSPPEMNRRGIDRLTNAQVRNAEPKRKPYKLTDGKGLFLAVMPNGSKLWRVKYRHGQGPRRVERVYSIGPLNEVGLAEARIKRDQARDWLREGKDPTIERRLGKATEAAKQATSFSAVADEWLRLQHFSPRHRTTQRMLLDRDVTPYFGNLPVAEITPTMVLEALRRIERRGTLEMCAKVRRLTSQVFRYAVQTGRCTSDPAQHLSGALKAPRTQHRATIPLRDMAALFKTLGQVPAELNTRLALSWVILTACRTGEMRGATWGEIEDGKLWRIPAERMKMDREHVVPLSTPAQSILKQARQLRTGEGPDALLFPGFTRHGGLSENALLALLARAGYFGRQTAHGFRASFSTWAHEVHEADPDVIEACLAHVKGGVRGIYNRASYLSKRRALLQAWADQCVKWGMKL